MLSNRIFKILIVLALVVLTVYTVRAIIGAQQLLREETPQDGDPALVAAEPEETTPVQPVGISSLDLVRIIELPVIPHDLAVDADGRIYVADSANSKVIVFDHDGSQLAAWGGEGNGEGQFAFQPPPDAPPFQGGFVALDSVGNVYVTDAYNNRVQKFGPDGNFIAAWTTIGPDGETLDVPGPVSVGKNGLVYVADFSGVHAYDTDGNFLRSFPGAGEAAVDSQGNLHIPIAFQNQMTKLTPEGEPLTAWGGEGEKEDGLFIFPKQIVVDENDHLYVADHSGRLQVFDLEGNFLSRFNITDKDSLQVQVPVILAAGPQGTLYVGAEDRSSVYVLRSLEESKSTDIYPEDSIAAVLEADGRFSIALSLFDQHKGADLGPWPWLQNPQRSITFFAPTDTAFAAVPQETMEQLMADPNLAGQLLCHHVLEVPVDSEALGLLQSRNTCVSLDQVTILLGGDGYTYDGANVIETDIFAGTNVIHVIDAVTGLSLLP